MRSVPFEADPVALLEEAGLVGVRMLKFDAKPCFVRGGVGMRELQLEGFTPAAPAGEQVEVHVQGAVPRGAGRQRTSLSRGRRVAVPAAVADRLRAGDLAGQFIVFEQTQSRPATVTACGH